MTQEVEQTSNASPAAGSPPPEAAPAASLGERITSATAESPEPTLGALVTAMTRRAPDAVLAACVIVGLLGAGAIAVTAPNWWRVLPPLVLLSTFGGWGIADRERFATGSRGVTFTVVRGVVILASLLAGGAMILAFMGVAIGRWIS